MSSSQDTTRSLDDALSSSQQAQQQQQQRPLLSHGRRRRSAPPPARLQWPAGGVGLLTVVSSSQPSLTHTQRTTHSASAINKACRPTKRSRKSHYAAYATTTTDSSDDTMMMWVDRYAPSSSSDLCVAPKKVKQVSEWIQEATNITIPPKKLLLLVGGPGIGKSTMVRVLAHELHVELLEWSDSYSSQYNHRDDDSYFTTQQHLMQVDRTTPLQLFQQFLQSSGFGYSSLELLQQPSTAAGRGGLQLTSTVRHNTSSKSKPQKKPRQLFTQQSTATSKNAPTKSMILVDELPNAHNAEGQAQLRDILSHHVTGAHIPTVLIYSEGSEGQSNPYDLERLIDPTVLYSPTCQIVHVNAVTTARLKKSIEAIVKLERLSLPKDRVKTLAEELHATSGGDLRFAINSLQFDQAGQCQQPLLGRGHAKTRIGKGTATTTARDVKLTTFHALGKLLYAKRAQDAPPAIPGDDRPPLAFDPEKVLDHCDLDLGSALNFLEFHSGDFFTDITEWSHALEYYSDASWLLDQSTNYSFLRKNSRHRAGGGEGAAMVSPIFPEGYVASLAGRAVAHANRHPAPSKFRSLTAPKISQVLRLRNENEATFRRLQRRWALLDLNSSSLLQDCVGSTHNFVTDRLPFMRQIVPADVESFVNQLHSAVSTTTNFSNGRNRGEIQQQHDEEEVRLEEQQREVLEMDDILDFDSSDEGECNCAHNKTPANSMSRAAGNSMPKSITNPYKRESRPPSQSSQSFSKPAAQAIVAAEPAFLPQQYAQISTSFISAAGANHDDTPSAEAAAGEVMDDQQSSSTASLPGSPVPPTPPRQPRRSNTVEVIVIDDTPSPVPPPRTQKRTQSEMVYIDL